MMMSLLAFAAAGQSPIKIPVFVRNVAPFFALLALWAFVMLLRRRG
jgi:hypothetical protein